MSLTQRQAVDAGEQRRALRIEQAGLGQGGADALLRLFVRLQAQQPAEWRVPPLEADVGQRYTVDDGYRVGKALQPVVQGRACGH